MHVVDIVFLCIAAVLTIIGIKRGLITEAFRLAAVAAGLVAAALYYGPAAHLLGFIAAPAGVRVSIAFVAVFVVVLAGVMAVGWAVRKVVHLTVLGWVDRVCGGCIGFAKCVLLAWVFSLAAGALPAPGVHRSLERSVVYTACSRAPLKLRMPDTGAITRSIEDAVHKRALEEIPRRLDEFRQKVDSAKAAQR